MGRVYPTNNFSGDVSITDDGTNILLSYARSGEKILRVRKSDGQIQVQAGVDTDVSI